MGDLNPPPWLGLLAPLPDDARPVRRAVLSEEVKKAHPGSEAAGYTSLLLDLSAPPLGLRVLLVTMDAGGTLVSASDMVHRRVGGRLEQESLGGRFEPDGSFRGTCWVGSAPDSDQETADWDLKPSAPTTEQVNRFRELIAQLRQRDPDSH